MPIDQDALRQIREALGVPANGPIVEVDGAALKAAREQAGYSQRTLAEAVAVSESYLSKLETGAKSRASRGVLARLAVLVGVEPDQLETS